MNNNVDRFNFGMPIQEAEMSGQVLHNQLFPGDQPIMPRHVEETRFPQVPQNMVPQPYHNNVRPLEEFPGGQPIMPRHVEEMRFPQPQHYGNCQRGRATQGQYGCEQLGRPWHMQPDVRYVQPHVPRQTTSYAQQIPNEPTLQLQSDLHGPPYLPPQLNSLSGHQQGLPNERRQQIKRLFKYQQHPYNEPGLAEMRQNIRQMETNRFSQPFQPYQPDSFYEHEYLQQRHLQQSGNLLQMQNVPHSSNVRQPQSHNSLSYIDQPSHVHGEQQQQSSNDHHQPQPRASYPQLVGGCCLLPSGCQHPMEMPQRASRSPSEQKYVPRSTFQHLGPVASQKMVEMSCIWLEYLFRIRFQLNDLISKIQGTYNAEVNFLNRVPHDIISLLSPSGEDEPASNDSPETSNV